MAPNSRDGVLGSGSDLEAKLDKEVHEMVSKLLKKDRVHHGFHYFDMVLGILLTLGVLGFLYWALKAQISRHFRRARQASVINTLKDMDAATLKQVLGEINLPSWVNFPDFERVGWLNDVIAQLWPNVDKAVTEMVREQLDPLLKANKPAWINEIALCEFTLGEKPPQVSGVKIYRSEAVVEEVVMELDFSWAGDQDVELVIKPFPKSLGPKFAQTVGKAISKFIQLKVGVEDVVFRGRLRVELKPLLNKVPIVGAIQVALVEQPSFSFDLTVYGGDITMLPGLEAWIASFIQDLVIKPYVLPERYVYPLIDPAAVNADRPKGMLYVKVLEAKDIPKADLFSKTDSFIELYVRDKREMRTQVKQNDLNPKWDEEFQLLVHVPDHQFLTLILYDHDMLSGKDELARASIPVRDIPVGTEGMDVWLEMEKRSGGKNVKPDPHGSHRVDVKPVTPMEDVTPHKYGGHAHGDGEQQAAGEVTAGGRNGVEVTKMEEITGNVSKRKSADGELEDSEPRSGSWGGGGLMSHLSGRHSNKPCLIHLQLSYLQFDKGEVDEAVKEDRSGVDIAKPEDSKVMNILKGGVLYVKVKQALQLPKTPFFKSGFSSALKVKAHVGNQKKWTASVKKRTPQPSWDETLEFTLDGTTAQRDDLKVVLEVWDQHWANQCKGMIAFPLKDVQRRRVKGQFPLEGKDAAGGQLMVELQWLGLMEAA